MALATPPPDSPTGAGEKLPGEAGEAARDHQPEE